MCVCGHIRRKVGLMSRDEQITLSRCDLETLLTEHGSCASLPAQGAVAESVPPLLNTAQLAARYGIASSTMRKRIHDGWFGEHTRFLNGKGYQIPRDVALEVESQIAAGFEYVDGVWRHSREVRSQAIPGASTPHQKQRETDSQRSAGRYGGWRDAAKQR